MSLILNRIAVLLLGHFSGAMLFIAVAMVPYWNSLDPNEFSSWFATNARFIGRLMIPLGGLAVIATVLAAAYAHSRRHPGWRWLGLAALLALLIAAVYPLYYTSANAALGSQTLGPSEIAAELVRWQTWHWARVAAGIAALYCALHGATLGRPAA